MKKIRKYLTIVLFALAFAFLVGCGESTPKELTDLEKMQESSPKGASSYVVQSTILYKSIEIYSEQLVYIKSDDQFNVTGTVKELASLAEKDGYYTTPINEIRDARFDIDFKNEAYATWVLTNTSTMVGTLTAEGCKVYATEGATNATITVNAIDGDIYEIDLEYVYKDQYVSVTALYNYE